MFNWSGNKGSFKGDIPFYGKSGLDFYTCRKVWRLAVMILRRRRKLDALEKRKLIFDRPLRLSGRQQMLWATG
jgi:hypothetical protein